MQGLEAFRTAPFGCDPSVTTAGAAEREVCSSGPSQCRHDDTIIRAALNTVFLDTSFGLFVNLRTIRQGGTFCEYSYRK
jgi:hypothetical protein